MPDSANKSSWDLECLNRRSFLKAGLLSGIAISALPSLNAAESNGDSAPSTPITPPSDLDETTIPELQSAMNSGKYSSLTITETYVARIKSIDHQGISLRSVIEINPDAIEIAEAMDRERSEKGPRGPLHGIPVLIKDNIDTADKMLTTAGSMSLMDSRPSKDAELVHRLRAAGAVILGKTNLSEWANIRSSRSSSGWSGRGGQTRNPYVLDRNPSGSSSGSAAAVSANLCAVAVGTETDGSIVSPSSTCGIVGLKPTVGLISRSGIIPISHSQDTAGPMARTVTDAAILLGILAGGSPVKSQSAPSSGKGQQDYTRYLKPDGLRGKRIGIVRQYFGFHEAVDRIMNEAIETLKQQGAVLIDPAPIETLGRFDDSELTVLLYELKSDLNSYLAARNASPVRTLKELIAFNERESDSELAYFGQDLFIQADQKGPLTEKEYRKAIKRCSQLAKDKGIDATMAKYNLDALAAPSGGPAWPTDLVNGDHFGGGSSNAAAVAGYPNITVPAGDIFGLPVGISFFGKAFSEPALLQIGFAFEQATNQRKPPRFIPSLAT